MARNFLLALAVAAATSEALHLRQDGDGPVGGADSSLTNSVTKDTTASLPKTTGTLPKVSEDTTASLPKTTGTLPKVSEDTATTTPEDTAKTTTPEEVAKEEKKTPEEVATEKKTLAAFRDTLKDIRGSNFLFLMLGATNKGNKMISGGRLGQYAVEGEKIEELLRFMMENAPTEEDAAAVQVDKKTGQVLLNFKNLRLVQALAKLYKENEGEALAKAMATRSPKSYRKVRGKTASLGSKASGTTLEPESVATAPIEKIEVTPEAAEDAQATLAVVKETVAAANPDQDKEANDKEARLAVAGLTVATNNMSLVKDTKEEPEEEQQTASGTTDLNEE